MNEADALELSQAVLWTILMVSSPLVLPAMLVGLIIAFFQALTQIQEQTLTFVPKIVVVFVSAIFAATFIGAQMGRMTDMLYGRIVGGF